VPRVTELFAALSLTTDLATAFPFEKGLRTCLLRRRSARPTDHTGGAIAASQGRDTTAG
jgi:hypothetical protein